MHRLSLVAAIRGYSHIALHELVSAGSVVVTHTGLVGPRHVGSSQIREGTHVPCLGRWIPNHWTAREAPARAFLTLGVCVGFTSFVLLLCFSATQLHPGVTWTGPFPL